MALIIQVVILVVSLYAISKGVERKTNARKKPETDTPRNRVVALLLVVGGLIIGFGTLFWMMPNLFKR
jgi:uncharacterized BrkB/YihY/UPF0761 family membrane protein